MPELPEVETTRCGIAAHVAGRRIARLIVREARLRWPIPPQLPALLAGKRVKDVDRRGKYLLMLCDGGCLIIHLGMSGSLRIVDADSPPHKHDHVDIVMSSGRALRFHDPRRFGAMIWTTEPASHPLLKDLGPEPWDATGEYLFRRSRGRTQAVKSFIMDSRTVAGVGNIYAVESLFEAGIHPRRAAGRVSKKSYGRLAQAMVRVVEQAIGSGGTTLRDFVAADGNPGYFRRALRVYERDGQPCRRCRTPIRRSVIAGRAAYHCPRCQR